MAEALMTYARVGPFDDPVATLDFNTFVVGAASIGLPTSMLRVLNERGWSFKVDTNIMESYTQPDWWPAIAGGKTIKLSKSQCYPIAGASARNSWSSMGTIYHECTHAYLIEFSSSLSTLIKGSERHYGGVNLKDGSSESDLHRVLHESAASYVGDSIEEIVRLLLIFKGLAQCIDVQNSSTGASFDKGSPKWIYAQNYELQEYQAFLLQDVFGNVGSLEVSKTIEPKLKTYLDRTLLEGVRQKAMGMAQSYLDRY